jgi:hypothetical protein
MKLLEPPMLRKILLALGALFLVAVAIQCTRSLVSGVAQAPGGRHRIGALISKEKDPEGYWTVIAINTGGGLLLGGVFIGLGLYLGRRKPGPSP